MRERLINFLRPYPFRGKARLLARFAPASGQREVTVSGSRMTLDLSDWIQRNVYLGTYEREESGKVRRLLHRGETFLDVGANIGYFTALGANLVGPSGRVIAVEPSPYAFGRLCEMVRINSLAQCETLNIGLSNQPGHLPIYLDESFHNHSPTMVSLGTKEYARVEVRTLDDLLEERKIERVDLLKLDVEGYELKVLTGAVRSLAQGRIRAIMIEFNEFWLLKAGTSPQEVLKLLEKSGLKDSLSAPLSGSVEVRYFFRAS